MPRSAPAVTSYEQVMNSSSSTVYRRVMPQPMAAASVVKMPKNASPMPTNTAIESAEAPTPRAMHSW